MDIFGRKPLDQKFMMTPNTASSLLQMPKPVLHPILEDVIPAVQKYWIFIKTAQHNPFTY